MDVIAKPFGWLMMTLFEFAKNYGLAVILFSLVVKVILLPFQMKSKHSMMRTSRLQPKMNELQKKHGANKQKYNEEVAKLYKEEKINPMSGCLWSLIPFPIILALYYAIREPLTTMMGVARNLVNQGGDIYNKIVEIATQVDPSRVEALTNLKDGYIQIRQAGFITEHFQSFAAWTPPLRELKYGFLGMDLGQVPDWQFLWHADWSSPDKWLSGFLLFLLPLVSGVLAYFSAKVSMKVSPTMGNPQQQSTSKSMMLMMPFMSVLFGFWMPGAIGVYMISQTVFSVAQDIWLTKRYTKILDAEDAVKLEQQRIKEAELEAKRLETERKKLENKTEVNPNTSKKKQQKTERQDQLEKAVEWEKKHAPVERAEDPSRVDTRRFARGRAYDPNRFEIEAGDGNGEEPVAIPAPAADEAPDTEEAPETSDRDAGEETAVEADENDGKAD